MTLGDLVGRDSEKWGIVLSRPNRGGTLQRRGPVPVKIGKKGRIPSKKSPKGGGAAF